MWKCWRRATWASGQQGPSAPVMNCSGLGISRMRMRRAQVPNVLEHPEPSVATLSSAHPGKGWIRDLGGIFLLVRGKLSPTHSALGDDEVTMWPALEVTFMQKFSHMQDTDSGNTRTRKQVSQILVRYTSFCHTICLGLKSNRRSSSHLDLVPVVPHFQKVKPRLQCSIPSGACERLGFPRWTQRTCV